MRSLLTLTFSFVLLTAYLEWVAPAAKQQASNGQLSQIVRAQSAPVKYTTTQGINRSPLSESPIIGKAIRVLNLSLPSDMAIDNSAITVPSQLVIDDSTQNPAKKIRYNAELVYDLDKGEDITGGKVNIEIPFG